MKNNLDRSMHDNDIILSYVLPALYSAYLEDSLDHGCESALDSPSRHRTLHLKLRPFRFHQSAPFVHLMMWFVGSPRGLRGSHLAIPDSQLPWSSGGLTAGRCNKTLGPVNKKSICSKDNLAVSG